MIRINRQTDYAVRVVLALAEHETNTRMSSRVIQSNMHIPVSFMPRIVSQLANNGLVKTYAGRDGGLELARPPAQISIQEVVEAFEGPILLSGCIQGKDEDNYPFHNNCHVRTKWGRIQVAMLREMAAINFADLAKEAKTNPLETIIPMVHQ